jgi:hypothetical protein
MRTAIALLLLLVPGLLPAGDTYTWVDENNERHWSDMPHQGAQKVELAPQSDYRPAPQAASPSLPAAAPPPRTPPSCAISQPSEDQVFFEVDSVTISVSITPAAPPGSTVSATLDGVSLAPTESGGTNFLVTPIDRGTHVAAAVVRDASGRTLCSAPQVTFHVRKHSIIKPR